MPVLTIHYTLLERGSVINEEIEWVSPSDWSVDQSVDSFKARHPAANVTKFLVTEVAESSIARG
jgi:hypothetical protein